MLGEGDITTAELIALHKGDISKMSCDDIRYIIDECAADYEFLSLQNRSLKKAEQMRLQNIPELMFSLIKQMSEAELLLYSFELQAYFRLLYTHGFLPALERRNEGKPSLHLT